MGPPLASFITVALVFFVSCFVFAWVWRSFMDAFSAFRIELYVPVGMYTSFGVPFLYLPMIPFTEVAFIFATSMSFAIFSLSLEAFALSFCASKILCALSARKASMYDVLTFAFDAILETNAFVFLVSCFTFAFALVDAFLLFRADTRAFMLRVALSRTVL